MPTIKPIAAAAQRRSELQGPVRYSLTGQQVPAVAQWQKAAGLNRR
jgi:hypothetical protein